MSSGPSCTSGFVVGCDGRLCDRLKLFWGCQSVSRLAVSTEGSNYGMRIGGERERQSEYFCRVGARDKI